MNFLIINKIDKVSGRGANIQAVLAVNNGSYGGSGRDL
jgi:hypothetical protein